MKSLGNFPDPFIAEIAGQSDAIRRAAAGLSGQIRTLERLAEVARGKTVVFTGMGSSYDACYPTVTELAASRMPALHVYAAELLHFRRNLLGPATLLVAVSQSGESAEVVRLVETVAGEGATVLAVTNGTGSRLAELADLVLDTSAGEERGPSTMTFAAALVVLAGAGRVVGGGTPAATIRNLDLDAQITAEAIERLLDRRSLPDELAAWFDGRATAVILGRGPARAAAEMGALTLKEAAGLPVESLETAQFRHGPLELASPNLAAIIIATEPQTRALDAGLAHELVETGAAVLLVVEDGDVPAGTLRLELGPLDRALAPAVSVLPAQLLAWKLAAVRGHSPGVYVHASKVTTRE